MAASERTSTAPPAVVSICGAGRELLTQSPIMTMTPMQKIIRIGDVLNGSEVEREEQSEPDHWRNASGYKPTGGHTLLEAMDAAWQHISLDEAFAPYRTAPEEPMDPMTAGEASSGLRKLCTLPSEVLGLTEFAGVLIAACEDGVYGVRPDGTYYSLAADG